MLSVYENNLSVIGTISSSFFTLHSDPFDASVSTSEYKYSLPTPFFQTFLSCLGFVPFRSSSGQKESLYDLSTFYRDFYYITPLTLRSVPGFNYPRKYVRLGGI